MLRYVVAVAALAVLGSGNSCWAQVPGVGRCPTITLASDFSAQRYFTGRWYEQRRFFAVFELGQKCAHADYALDANGTVSVTNSGYREWEQKRTYANGVAYCESAQPAYCHVRFRPGSPYGDYKVLATDYDNYSLIFSCKEVMGLFNVQFAWLLTRQKAVSDQLIANAYQIFQSNGVDTSHLMTTVQDCTDN